MDFSTVLYEDSDFILELGELHLRYCDSVRADPAEVRVLNLVVIFAFESDLIDIVYAILQKFL